MKKHIIFDFDGTLANTLDTGVDIYNRIAHEYGCKQLQKERSKILQNKKPHDLMVELEVTFLKLPFLLLRLRHELFMEIKNVKPFQGVVESLNSLKKSGFILGVVTSNSRKNVEQFFEEHKILNLFSTIYTSKHLFGKDKVIVRYMKKYGIEKEAAIYVGDETRDIEAAKKVGIPIVSVGWGFNSKELLELYKPDVMIDDPSELQKAVLSL
jgi:phosphoglycolate phosphatase